MLRLDLVVVGVVVFASCGSVSGTDAGDAGTLDAGADDAGTVLDAGSTDAGHSDAGVDAGTDGGPTDAGPGVCDPFQTPPVPPLEVSDGGCGTDAELCFANHQANCGQLLATDRCGVQRTISSCGTCTSPLVCGGDTSVGADFHHCGGSFCVNETDPAFCQRLGKNCGSVTDLDNCGATRTAVCGTCSGGSCGGERPNVCSYLCAETDTQICARYGFSIGRLHVPDCCGYRRDVSCGVGTQMERMAFVLPPIPTGPGIRCWGGQIPKNESPTSMWIVDPDVILDTDVRVRRVPGNQACLTGAAAAVVAPPDGCYFTCTPNGQNLSCTSTTFTSSTLEITPTSSTVSLNAARGGSTFDNGMYISRCEGTGPAP